MLLGAWVGALAQGLPVGSVLCCEITNVNFRAVRFDYGTVLHQWAAEEWPTKTKIIVETVQSAIRSTDGAVSLATNQIPHFGGPLQYLANRADTTIGNGSRMPFGGNILFPLARGRVEIFGGSGGAYFQPTLYVRPGTAYVQRVVPYVQPNSWVTQTSFGGRAALDPEHHFWLGASAYYLTNFADKTRRWISSRADVTVRFGR